MNRKEALTLYHYDEATIDRMITFCASLCERDRRAYAAIEAYRLDRGGVTSIANLFGMSPETLKRGRDDLDSPGRLPTAERQRAEGAGRRGVCAEQLGLEAAFDELIQTHIAGDPMNADVKWTDLQPSEIVDKLGAQGFSISENTVRSLLRKKSFRKRKPCKVKAIGTCDPHQRNDQFENIKALRKEYEAAGLPVLSVDTKKKEFLGGLYRDGKLYCWNGVSLERFDHDFPHLSEGKIVPHGIYDVGNNSGFITLGTSAETPGFVGECIRLWWNYRGRHDYEGCHRILLLMDGGGANSHRTHQFKREMLKLATRIGLEIEIAHYPPYCSKWNPIEHRLFPHVTRSLQGVYLDSVETMQSYINEKAKTSTGLNTKAYILDKEFEYGYKDDVPLPEGYPLVRSEILPQWNYTCYPSIEYTNLLN